MASSTRKSFRRASRSTPEHLARLQGDAAVDVTWDEREGGETRSADILAQYKALAESPGAVAAHIGDAAGDREGGESDRGRTSLPLSRPCGDGADERRRASSTTTRRSGPVAVPDRRQGVPAKSSASTPDKVKIDTKFAGGVRAARRSRRRDYAPRRRWSPRRGSRDPVKLRVDPRGRHAGRLLPAGVVHRVKAGLDAEATSSPGSTLVGQSIFAGTPFERLVKNGVDATSVEGVTDPPYAIPNFHVELHTTKIAVPVLWWRSVGHTHTAYVVET